jgi:hypothetical protein
LSFLWMRLTALLACPPEPTSLPPFIRALYNARARVPALQRLTFVLIGVAAPVI